MWSPNDLQLLRENYDQQNLSETAEMLGRSYNSIRMKAWRLGLRSAYHFCTIPNEITSDVAYILGVLCGDGSLSTRNNKWSSKRVSLGTKDRDFANAFAEAMFRVFSRRLTVTSRWKKDPQKKMIFMYEVYCEHRQVGEYLASFGLFGSYTWKIPETIKSSSSEVKRAFLRGLYDSEGSVHFWKKGGLYFPCVQLTTVNPSTLHLVDLLTSMGIKATSAMHKRIDRSYYTVAISNMTSLAMFAKLIGFSIQRKQEKLVRHLRVPRTGAYAKVWLHSPERGTFVPVKREEAKT